MRRSPLVRRTPLRRSGKASLLNGSPPRKRTPIAPMSRKRRAEAPLRAAVRNEALYRAGYRCQAPESVPGDCWGPLDCHEVEARGTHPGSHLRPEVVVVLCRGHHEWVGANPAEAERLGLRRRATK